LDFLIRFKQSAAGVAQQLVPQVIELAFGEPLAAIGRAIYSPNRVAEYIGQNPLAEVAAEAVSGFRGDERVSLVDDHPAQRGELIKERFFDVEILGHCSGC
jgi:hypothetical protein